MVRLLESYECNIFEFSSFSFKQSQYLISKKVRIDVRGTI